MKIPRMQEANDVVPYTGKEIQKIIAACDEIGRRSYERRRARAMTLVMRCHTRRLLQETTNVIFLTTAQVCGAWSKGAWRTMDAVFKRSGVVGADPHRFRHTLASELLGKGGKLRVIASILGDSAATISRYYAK
jgi:site-specific recombinase XerD